MNFEVRNVIDVDADRKVVLCSLPDEPCSECGGVEFGAITGNDDVVQLSCRGCSRTEYINMNTGDVLRVMTSAEVRRSAEEIAKTQPETVAKALEIMELTQKAPAAPSDDTE